MKSTEVLKAIQNRFACKNYQDTPIAKEDLDAICEAGRLTPTSFGMEHFDIHVYRSSDILDVCFYQESMKTAPITMVLTVKKAKYYDPDGAFVKARGVRFPGTVEAYVEDFRGYYEFLRDGGKLDMWAKAQTYIALGNMMTAASELGIESCAIEGFNNEKLIERMGLSNEEDQVGIVCAFGYPKETRERIRREFDDVVKYHI
ncbi:MAG: nitroreductase family protein [Spirochaetales bacterium]|nr:nitroreductase family protein [Candidatus Physcosoma equi]